MSTWAPEESLLNACLFDEWRSLSDLARLGRYDKALRKRSRSRRRPAPPLSPARSYSQEAVAILASLSDESGEADTSSDDMGDIDEIVLTEEERLRKHGYRGWVKANEEQREGFPANWDIENDGDGHYRLTSPDGEHFTTKRDASAYLHTTHGEGGRGPYREERRQKTASAKVASAKVAKAAKKVSVGEPRSGTVTLN